MRSHVYRNLDKPFKLLGYTPLQLVVLCVVLVGGSELAEVLGADRLWAILFTSVTALSLFMFNRAFGELFGRRLTRFLKLPSHLYSKFFFFRRIR